MDHPALPVPGSRSHSGIADRAAGAFPPNACVAGFALFAARKVELTVIDESAVDALVKVKSPRRVSLRAAAGMLSIRCSCPAPPARGEASSTGLVVGCKHAWASLLEADREGVLATLRRSRGALRVGTFDDPAGPATGPKKARAAKETARAKSPPPRRKRARAVQPAKSACPP